MIALITPYISNLFVLLWIFGLTVLWVSTRKTPQGRKTGIIFLTVLWLLGTGPVGGLILRPLEKQYPPPQIKTLKEQGVRQVVVLTGGGFPLQGELFSSAFPYGSLYRFIAGLELASRLGPDTLIIFSGTAGRERSDLKTSEVMEELCRLLMPARPTASEKRSSSTVEHPDAVKPYVHGPLVLITSAYHMPRTMRTFEHRGLHPIPYPVDFLVTDHSPWEGWIPSFENFWKLNIGFREYLALAAYRLKGW